MSTATCSDPCGGVTPAYLRKAQAQLNRAEKIADLEQRLPHIIKCLERKIDEAIECGAENDCVILKIDGTAAEKLVGTECDSDVALGLVKKAAEAYRKCLEDEGYDVRVEFDCDKRKVRVEPDPCDPCSRSRCITKEVPIVRIKVCFAEAEVPDLPRAPDCDDDFVDPCGCDRDAPRPVTHDI